MLFVLILVFACLQTGESSESYTGQSTKEELDRMQSELERLQAEIDRLSGSDTFDGHRHLWIPATFTQPQTCSICGATEGKPVPESAAPSEDEIRYLIQNSGYPTVSNKRIELALPNDSSYLSDLYRATVQASVSG